MRLRVGERLLLGLAVGGGVLDDLVEGACRAYPQEKVFLWAPVGYRKRNFRVEINRMIRRGWVQRLVDKGQVYLRLKGEGRKRLLKKLPVLWQTGKEWDGFWRLLIFDVPEKRRAKRDKVRRWLRRRGFGVIQRSVYITPHDFSEELKKFLQQEGLWGYVVLLEAKQKYLGNPRDLAYKVWRLAKLTQLYRQVADKLSGEFGFKDEGERRRFYQRVLSEYLAAVVKDPFLPAELLPKDWEGWRVYEMVRKTVSLAAG